MIEQIAQVSGRDVSRETISKLTRYVELLIAESDHQNLIAASTKPAIWERHIIDSAQLCRFAPPAGPWLDIGAGAGLPGIIIAIVTREPIVLVEPRKLRAEFLRRCVAELGLSQVDIANSKVERVSGAFDTITARAVASVERLFGMAWQLSQPKTRWVLPKGRGGAKELAEAQHKWQGEFRIERSVTDPEGVILIAEHVRPRNGHRGGTIA